MKKYGNNEIVSLVGEDLPSTKLVTRGKSALTNAELLSILLKGMPAHESLELARTILKTCNQNLNEIGKMGFMDLCKIQGMSTGRACSIVAALELGNRKRSEDVLFRDKVAGSRDVFELFHAEMADLQYEQFWTLLMNRANRVIKKVNISEGGISGTVADPKKIFKMALDHNASSMILCHNHPSGNIQPSEADIRLTKKLKEAGLLLDLPVLDHLIFGTDSYFSFADEGMI